MAALVAAAVLLAARRSGRLPAPPAQWGAPGLAIDARTDLELDLAAPAPQSLDLTIVVPHYNVGLSLKPHVAELVDVLRATGTSFEVVAVADGTTDGSDEGLEKLGAEVRTLRLAHNEGKGMAIRAGLASGRGAYLGFIDGDGDIPAAVIGRFVDTIDEVGPDAVIGSKRHPGSTVAYPPFRRLYSSGFQLLTRVLFGLEVTETQAGVKVFSRDLVAAVLPVLRERGYVLDLELLAVARRLGFEDVVELPIEIRERSTTSISIRAVFEMLQDTAALAWRFHVRHAYDRGAGSPGGLN